MTPWDIFAGLTIIGIALHMFFFYRLRRDSHQEWVRLGSPNPFLPNDARSGWAITKYILTGSFERLPDKKLIRLGRVLRYYEWFYVMVFLSLTLLFFYSVLS